MPFSQRPPQGGNQGPTPNNPIIGGPTPDPRSNPYNVAEPDNSPFDTWPPHGAVVNPPYPGQGEGDWGIHFPVHETPPLTDDYSAPPLPMPPQFPSGGPLSPTELGEIESSIPNPTRDEELFGGDQFPLVDFPQAPAPQTPPLPGNPIAGRGPASPQTPKLPNPFGGGR